MQPSDAEERERDLDVRAPDLARREEQAVLEGRDRTVLGQLADERDALAW